MLFTSYKFLLTFLPVVFGIFVCLSYFKQNKYISIWLVLASIVFYLFWNPWDLFPLIFSIIINYGFYHLMKNKLGSLRRLYLILAVGFNIIFLAYYKYIDFFVSELFNITLRDNKIDIPLGISFYTFTQIAFLIDCYKKQYEKNDFVNYFLFVSYFPHLVCGPILSFKELYPQLINSDKFKASLSNASLFVFCFSIGLFKKIVIGDFLGEYVSKIFDAPSTQHFDSETALLGILCYAMQLYFDFSGYSDMAVGLSYLFGLKIPDNFNAPYQATSIIDFWRRWHISLSNFLKNYLYIPLGGNRGSSLELYRNLSITMLLGGLWHGASWNYIFWGIYHGLLLSINHFLNTSFQYRQKITDLSSFPLKREYRKIKILITFSLVSLGWVLFRSPTLEHALNIYASLLSMHQDFTRVDARLPWFVLSLAVIIVFCLPDTLTLRERFFEAVQKNKKTWVASSAVACGFMTVIGILSFIKVQYFLYSGF